jgi:arylsulfatase A-like enzyme
MMHVLRWFSPVCLPACAALLAASAWAEPAPPPNVVWILADDLAFGDLASVNDGRTRTPLDFSWPATLAPGRSNFPARFTDLRPTLADLCELGRPKLPLDGVRFAAHLRGSPAPPARHAQQAHRRFDRGTRALPPPTDPTELTDVSAQNAEHLACLYAAAGDWAASVEADRPRR